MNIDYLKYILRNKYCEHWEKSFFFNKIKHFQTLGRPLHMWRSLSSSGLLVTRVRV